MFRRKLIDKSKVRILVIDDSRVTLELLTKMLGGQGYRISVASSGADGLLIAAEINPDLILLDVVMPELDGFETCRRLKANKKTRGIPVVFISMKSRSKSILAGFNAGAIDYISKPIHREEVCARVLLHVTQQMQLRIDQNSPAGLIEDAIVTACPPGFIETANPAALQLFGYTLAELDGKPLSRLLLPEYAQECERIFSHRDHERALKHGFASSPTRVEGRHQDGSPVHLNLSIRRLDLTYPLHVCLMHKLEPE